MDGWLELYEEGLAHEQRQRQPRAACRPSPKSRAKLPPCPSEHQEQVSLVGHLALHHPLLRFFAIPNGGLRSKKTALDLQAEGVQPGVPDLMFPALFLFIEMKRQDASPSDTEPEQLDWIAYLQSVGYQAVVCKGADAALAVLEQAIQARGLITHNFPIELTGGTP